MPTTAVVQAISFIDTTLVPLAKAKARRQHQSLSGYVCSLIEADLKKAGLYPNSSVGAVAVELVKKGVKPKKRAPKKRDVRTNGSASGSAPGGLSN